MEYLTRFIGGALFSFIIGLAFMGISGSINVGLLIATSTISGLLCIIFFSAIWTIVLEVYDWMTTLFD
ncbi:MAG: hypothetical protein MK193_12275 [Lentisphaeria bacterium]|nr:hypothetical protein [Lentisphaeria bacterium]